MYITHTYGHAAAAESSPAGPNQHAHTLIYFLENSLSRRDNDEETGGNKRCKQMRGLHDTRVRVNREIKRGKRTRVRSERVKGVRRICRGVKRVFVLDALETADIATIRPSFRGKERELEQDRRRKRKWDLVLLARVAGVVGDSNSGSSVAFMCQSVQWDFS